MVGNKFMHQQRYAGATNLHISYGLTNIRIAAFDKRLYLTQFFWRWLSTRSKELDLLVWVCFSGQGQNTRLFLNIEQQYERNKSTLLNTLSLPNRGPPLIPCTSTVISYVSSSTGSLASMHALIPVL